MATIKSLVLTAAAVLGTRLEAAVGGGDAVHRFLLAAHFGAERPLADR